MKTGSGCEASSLQQSEPREKRVRQLNSQRQKILVMNEALVLPPLQQNEGSGTGSSNYPSRFELSERAGRKTLLDLSPLLCQPCLSYVFAAPSHEAACLPSDTEPQAR